MLEIIYGRGGRGEMILARKMFMTLCGAMAISHSILKTMHKVLSACAIISIT
jgi:hypothetical protein